MSDWCGRFYFARDMNGDQIFSISDVWLMIKYVWLLPAKAVIDFVQSNPLSAEFFEVNCSTGESWGGAIFSAFIWFVVLSIVCGILSGPGNAPGSEQ